MDIECSTDDLIEKYRTEFKEDVLYNQMNILDKTLELPTIRHKWSSRLVYARKAITTFENKKKNIKKAAIDKFSETSDRLPKAAMDAKLEESDTVKELTAKIDLYKRLASYLEQCEKNLYSASFDMKNSIELIKMETQ